jgi:hypothetical protein
MGLGNFYGVRKNNFKTADSQGTVEKAAGEAELGLGGQVEHRNGDGDVQELGRRIAGVFRRVAGKDSGSHTLNL